MTELWHVCQTNPFPFVVRYRVYNTFGKYIATFRFQEDALEYVEFKLGLLTQEKETK